MPLQPLTVLLAWGRTVLVAKVAVTAGVVTPAFLGEESARAGLWISFGYYQIFSFLNSQKSCLLQSGWHGGWSYTCPVVKSPLYPFSAFSAVPGTAASREKHLKIAHH